uniref:Uncharacterized protein n=1 Tax=Monopterus albus TaxID=43700 RepID=A0A3Q3JNN2_MONAL
MKINENTLLEGHKVVLVPYNANHVTRYHEWMKCPELQHLSASEPLTLKQGYNMQGSWREDDDSKTSSAVNVHTEHEQCMVGDVNMFLMDPTDLPSAELEIMIAGDAQCAYLESDSKSKVDSRFKKTMIFMQDNAPSHASKYSTAWLASKGLKDERVRHGPLPHLT